jgi:hypothetical protein
VFFNVLVSVIKAVAAVAVVEVLILIYSVDKVEWAYVFVDKAALEVCSAK